MRFVALPAFEKPARSKHESRQKAAFFVCVQKYCHIQLNFSIITYVRSVLTKGSFHENDSNLFDVRCDKRLRRDVLDGERCGREIA